MRLKIQFLNWLNWKWTDPRLWSEGRSSYLLPLTEVVLWHFWVQWDWTCSCMLLIDCPLKHSFLLLPWCDDHEILRFVVAVQNIPLQYIKISPLSTLRLRSPTPAAAPHSFTTTPRNTHTFHKTCHTSAAQSGVILDSVNSPDGELNKSYNETLNDGETEG